MMNRRHLLGYGVAVAGLALSGNVRAAACSVTPRQGEGPFFPVAIAEQDWDLTRVAGRTDQATGTVIEVRGRIVDSHCRALSGADIEIWQANHHGRYDHPGDRGNPRPLDANFQGYARLTADADGTFRFRTIRPGAYPASADWWRPPHIHFKVRGPGARPLTTQMYFAGDPLNDQDWLLGRVAANGRGALEVSFTADTADNIPVGQFNIVLDEV